MKKALILGIGSAQVDAIRYLKQRGWWIIACSYRQEGPGLEFVDQFELINISDIYCIEQLARDEGVEFVYSVGSDLAMPSVAEVSERLKLPCFITRNTANLLQSKIDLRNFLAEKEISPVRYQKIQNLSDAATWAHYPAIMKPTDSQGQRGIARVASFEDIQNNLDSALNASRSRTAILEEMLDGPEVSVNAFVINGQIVFIEISDRKVLADYPGGIPYAHVLPTQVASPDAVNETKKLVERCIHVLGIQNGPVYFQIILGLDGPRIVEITPRLDGCHMWRLIKAAIGIDLLDMTFRLLEGDQSSRFYPDRQHQLLSLIFLYQAPGTEFSTQHHHLPADVVYREFYFNEGQRVSVINGHMEKVGYYIKQGQP